MTFRTDITSPLATDACRRCVALIDGKIVFEEQAPDGPLTAIELSMDEWVGARQAIDRMMHHAKELTQ